MIDYKRALDESYRTNYNVSATGVFVWATHSNMEDDVAVIFAIRGI